MIVTFHCGIKNFHSCAKIYTLAICRPQNNHSFKKSIQFYDYSIHFTHFHSFTSRNYKFYWLRRALFVLVSNRLRRTRNTLINIMLDLSSKAFVLTAILSGDNCKKVSRAALTHARFCILFNFLWTVSRFILSA